MKFGYIVLVLAVAAWGRTDDIAKLERTSFGKVLLNTVALQLSMNKQVQKVVDLLENLKEGLLQEQSEHQGRHDQYQAEAADAINTYNANISQASSDLEAAVQDINTYTPLRDQTEQDLAAAQAALSQLVRDKEEAEKRRNREREEFEIRVVEHDSALQAADQAAKLVSELETSEVTFLQKPVLAQIASQMNSVRRVAPSHAALLRVLVQISTSKHASKELVGKCLGLIEKLKLSLQASKELDALNEANAQSAFDAYISEVTNSILSTEARIGDLTVKLGDYRYRVNDAIARRDDAQARLDSNTVLRDDRETARQLEQQDYDRETERRIGEIDIVDQTVDLLENRLGDMSDYASGRVDEV